MPGVAGCVIGWPAEGVEVSLVLPGSATPVAIVAVRPTGEPLYQTYGETTGNVMRALADRLEDVLGAAAGGFISSNSLVGTEEREVTMRAREAALGFGRPVVFEESLGRPVAVRSTIGASDALTGLLLARLATSGLYPAAVAAVAAAPPEAAEQSALACERWGALE